MGLRVNLLKEPVSRLALRDPVVVHPDTSVRDCIGQMREQGLGCVIAIDNARRPLGIFTEAMLRQLLVTNAAAVENPVREHMTREIQLVQLTDPVVKVLETMQHQKTRFVGVIDEDGRLAGLTGQKGLMEYIAEHFPQQVMVQRIGVAPYLAEREGA